jgi:hypothetical protein
MRAIPGAAGARRNAMIFKINNTRLCLAWVGWDENPSIF